MVPSSSGMNTLTVKSLVSVPYLFFTRRAYFPESTVLTAVMVKLAHFPDSYFRMQWSSAVNVLSFFSHVISGAGSPQTLQVRLSACSKCTKGLLLTDTCLHPCWQIIPRKSLLCCFLLKNGCKDPRSVMFCCSLMCYQGKET